MEPKFWIELAAIVAVPIAVLAVVTHRVKTSKGMGVRSIQFLAISILPAVVLVLALEGILEKSAVGALLGTLIGYLFGNIGEYDRSKYRDQGSRNARDEKPK